ncbi:MAG TPA: ferredoxin [Rhizomicrobium sp.]|nr:ferredoxin [Rhizomicrobium sp.]
MTQKFEIRLDRPRCIGAENCARYAPATFDLQDGQVVLLPEPHDNEAALRAAAAACPMQVIHLEPTKENAS